MKYEIVCNVHAVTHVQQLNLVLIEENIHYDLRVLKENETVQLLHTLTTQFCLIFLVLKKDKKQETISKATIQMLLVKVLMIFGGKIERNDLLMVVMVKLYKVS